MGAARWNDTEIRMLRELHSKMPAPEIARLLRRSLIAVHTKVSQLGLSKGKQAETVKARKVTFTTHNRDAASCIGGRDAWRPRRSSSL